MRRVVHRFFFPSLAAVVGVSLAMACGAEVSIPDPDAPDTGVVPDGAADGPATGETGTDGGNDAADVTCADVLPDDVTGIYVTTTGTNSGTCGTRAAPCKTINFSVTRAGAALRTKVYAARGTYVEKVTLAAGVEVIGGWDVTGTTTWKQTCVSPEEAVVVRAPPLQNITFEARDLGGEAKLSLLKIESKATAVVLPGESEYGIVATGATTALVLNNVDIEMGEAGVGANGNKGDAGVDGGPACPVGSGVVGTPGTQGAGAPNGTYDPLVEYTPGVGANGGTGTAGGDGTPGGGTGTCVQCGTCDLDLVIPGACIFTPTVQGCGDNGTAGCGGGPGGPGQFAAGGGSNIGVFAWDATVTINGGKVKSGDGANGGAGGAGGTGGAATRGTAGANAATCITSCLFNAALGACGGVKSQGIGGAAGGAGAAGGLGGPGGGGGGGSSFAIFQGGAGVVTTTAGTTLAHGKAGKGGLPVAGAGANGAAADRVP